MYQVIFHKNQKVFSSFSLNRVTTYPAESDDSVFQRIY